jgi:hypothetical protein
MSTEANYLNGLEELILLDLKRTSVPYKGDNELHFLRLQSLLRCSIEHCTAAFEIAKKGQILSALVLARTSLEHALLARFLDQVPDGHELSEIAIDKHLSNLSRMAGLAGSSEASAQLRELIKFEQKDHDRVPTSPNTLIGKFSQKEMLSHMYFLLSQASHPISAFLQYIELEEDGVSKRIRRRSLNQDLSSVLPFLFQILSIALLTDASISKDHHQEESVFQIASRAFASPDFELTTD